MTWTFRPFYNTTESTAVRFTHDQFCRADLVQGGQEKSINHLYEKRNTCKRSESPMHKSEVHLLPAFVLPPRGSEGKKKAEGKRREVNARHHKHLGEMTEE